jgi:xanthine dehydrogenase YagS FAD-binding subunit
LAVAAPVLIRSARPALGGVAHKPWRSEKAEALLVCKPPGREAWLGIANEILSGAKGYEHNAFKIAMARQAIVRAFTLAAGNGDRA